MLREVICWHKKSYLKFDMTNYWSNWIYLNVLFKHEHENFILARSYYSLFLIGVVSCSVLAVPISFCHGRSMKYLYWLMYICYIMLFLQVYLCEKLSLVNEMYFAITLDRTTAGPVCILDFLIIWIFSFAYCTCFTVHILNIANTSFVHFQRGLVLQSKSPVWWTIVWNINKVRAVCLKML